MLKIPFYKPSIGAEEIDDVSCVCDSIKDIVAVNRRAGLRPAVKLLER
jgi:hypothetical protein